MNKTRNKVAAIVVAGGRGTRAKRSADDELPKQYQFVAGRPVMAWALKAFLDHPDIDVVLPVISKDAGKIFDETIDLRSYEQLMRPVFGGATRQQSVRNGLAALSGQPIGEVLIHDAARPLVDREIIDSILQNLKEKPGAVTGVPQADTLKQSSENDDFIEKTISREKLWSVQTPQGFDYQTIVELHNKYSDLTLTDDASLFERAGLPVALCSGNSRNIKITTAQDFDTAERLMQSQSFDFRTGQGFDVHRFKAGNSVTLCGVSIPHDKSLTGHSDADVAMHALTDALLGAIAEGDIGTHFPPTDQQWKNVASEVFLKRAKELIFRKQGTITHCDITIICESPKVAPHRNAMIKRLADILQIHKSRISVKATTTEQLGFTGRKEGISALATATVRLIETGNNYE